MTIIRTHVVPDKREICNCSSRCLLSIREAGAALRVGPKVIARLIKNGELLLVKNLRRVKIDPADIKVNKTARCPRVPAQWLRHEVKAGRLPGLQAGRVILVHVPTIARRLAELTKANACDESEVERGN